jgi:formylglycine-generating enzyme required for sulfatase activity
MPVLKPSLSIDTETFETLTLGADGQPTAHASCQARIASIPLAPGVALQLVAIPDGMFRMGSIAGQGAEEERPQHLVSAAAFWIARDLTSQDVWKAVMGRLPDCRFKGGRLPVENLRCTDAQDFCRRLAQRTGLPFRLPSEAEWEYACRAGTSTPFSTGETITTDHANYVGLHTFAREPVGVYRHTTTPRGAFPPNPFGVRDLHGNLWEMCADAWHPDYTAAPFGSRAWETGGEAGYVVARGGSWHEPPVNCRSATRLRVAINEHDDFFGFRAAVDDAAPV